MKLRDMREILHYQVSKQLKHCCCCCYFSLLQFFSTFLSLSLSRSCSQTDCILLFLYIFFFNFQLRRLFRSFTFLKSFICLLWMHLYMRTLCIFRLFYILCVFVRCIYDEIFWLMRFVQLCTPMLTAWRLPCQHYHDCVVYVAVCVCAPITNLTIWNLYFSDKKGRKKEKQQQQQQLSYANSVRFHGTMKWISTLLPCKFRFKKIKKKTKI